MPGLEFPGVWAKINRAGKHLDDLICAIALFNARNNPSGGRQAPPGERQASGSHFLFRMSFPEPPDLTGWALVIGDVLYDLRSALDHLAWQLAEIGSGPTERTEFPIFQDCDKFKQRQRNGEYARHSGFDKIAGLPKPLQTEIETLQPYHAGYPPALHPLAVLHKACNDDKHRLLTPTVILPSKVDWAIEADGSSWFWPVFTSGPLEEGAVLFAVYTDPPASKVRVRLDFAYLVTIEFAGELGGPIGTLGKLKEHVEGVARHLIAKANEIAEGSGHGPTSSPGEG